MKQAWKNWTVLSPLLGSIALSALGVAYWSSVQDRERYLQSRNFRLLADLADQTQAVLFDAEKVVRGAFGAVRPTTTGPDAADGTAGKPLSGHEISATWAREVVRYLAPKARGREASSTRNADRRVTGVELWRGDAAIDALELPRGDVVSELRRYRSGVVGSSGAVRIDWMPPAHRLPALSFQLPASALLADVFRPERWQRAFTTVAVATPDGRVVYAAGPQSGEVMASSVASLLPSGANGTDLKRFATTISETTVHLSGVEYRMFAQPCCRSETVAEINEATRGLVVVGLVDADALGALSLAISPVLVMAGAAFVLACLVGWAFLKCALMGPQQRLGRHDVVNLLTSGVFGLALATIVLLTTAAYARLSADIDGHLRQMATALQERFEQEVSAAVAQLTARTSTIARSGCADGESGRAPVPGGPLGDPCQTHMDPPTDDFLTFSMLDGAGLQAAKVTVNAASRTVVDVNQRTYYQRTRARNALWFTPDCPNGCYLEYLSSWNTGLPQVVIAMPSGIDRLPVAAISIPMRSMLEPVLPPGFEFAIVDSAGLVQLHSDSQRNGLEDLLLETDQNPRLRSLLAAHGAGKFNTLYGGHPYRGYVQPAAVPGWSIVVLHAKGATRALVLEWFVVAMLLQVVYTLAWTCVLVVAIGRGAPWLWPDPLRRHWYVPLAWLGVTGSVIWVIVAWTQPVRTTAVVGAATPAVLWVMAYAVLAVRQPGVGAVRDWTELCRDYRCAGAVLLMVTSVVPAASFYAMSYDRHVEAFVKERQIALAQRVNAVATCEGLADGEPGDRDPRRFDSKVFDGTFGCVSEAQQLAPDTALASFVHGALEDLMPYFTPASVALRELMHRHSDDGVWVSRRGGTTQVVAVRAVERGVRVQVSSALPPALGVSGGVDQPRIVFVAALCLVLLLGVAGLAYLIVRFLAGRVLLVDIVEPIRRKVQLRSQAGQHVHVVCDDPQWLPSRVDDAHVIQLAGLLGDGRSTTLGEALAAVSEKAPEQQRIAIGDLEPPLDKDGKERSMASSLLCLRVQVVSALINAETRTVLLFTRRSNRELQEWIGAHCPGADVSKLRVIEVPPRSTTDTLERWAQYLRHLWQGWKEEFVTRWQDWRVPLRWRARLLEVERQSRPEVKEICDELAKRPEFAAGSLTRDQILEEIEEQAEAFYRQIWQARAEEDRVVLEHVARHGLASAASRRVVRRLLSEGLLRKDPELRLMNQSFRRFVLETERRQEVALLEQNAGPSLWDRLRVPIGVSVMIALVFLLATQREAFDTTVSMAGGVSTAVLTISKLLQAFTQVAPKSSGIEQKANV